jgi:fructose transport system permease protein
MTATRSRRGCATHASSRQWTCERGQGALVRVGRGGLRGDAARLAGINTGRTLLAVYGIAGLICAIGGWVLIGRIGAASPLAGQTANLDSITAVVIGGTSLFGGRGSIVGTLVGALIVGVFRNGLALYGLDNLWQEFAVGLLIIVAVALDQWIRKVAA